MWQKTEQASDGLLFQKRKQFVLFYVKSLQYDASDRIIKLSCQF